MDGLRDQIAAIIDEIADCDVDYAREYADKILAIPEIADALRACADGGELDVYRANCEFPD